MSEKENEAEALAAFLEEAIISDAMDAGKITDADLAIRLVRERNEASFRLRSQAERIAELEDHADGCEEFAKQQQSLAITLDVQLDEAKARIVKLEKALKYARRFLRREDHDLDFVDTALRGEKATQPQPDPGAIQPATPAT